jgi:hypothetical protein
MKSLQEMEEMKNCYDSLLSAAAATTNSVYGNQHFNSTLSQILQVDILFT